MRDPRRVSIPASLVPTEADYPPDDADDAGSRIRSRRLLAGLLLASALLHALVIAVVAGPDWRSPLAPPLTVVLAPRPAPAAMPEGMPETAPAKLPSRREATPTPLARRPRLAAEHLRRESPPEVEAVAVRAPVPESSAPPAAVPAFAPPATRSETPPPQAPPAAPRRPDGQAIAAYGSKVTELVAAHRSYPKIAQVRGWEGTTLLEITVDSNGRVLATRIARSSGHDVLDREAQAMVGRAGPLPPLPADAGEPVLRLPLPVLFVLTRE